MSRELVLGVLAHVDAGKTTLCEQLLLETGVIRSAGRVDHGASFMDSHLLERERGITIFCGQASFDLPSETEDLHVTLMDTPGHVDFSGEMERALSALDAAVLVVSCAEGVQSHTVTLAKLLRAKRIPTLVFLNKTDRENTDIPGILRELKRLVHPECLPAELRTEEDQEALAALDDMLMERYIDGEATEKDFADASARCFAEANWWPVFCGSALYGKGIRELLSALPALTCSIRHSSSDAPFKGKVYRVRRFDGQRMLLVKFLSGRLQAREDIQTLSGVQKVSGLFSIQGDKLRNLDCLLPGMTAAVASVSAQAGECIGQDPSRSQQELVPLMSVRVIPVSPPDTHKLLAHLRELEEEDPLLQLRPEPDGINAGIMGEVQIEVLKRLLKERFGDIVEIEAPRVLYRETIGDTVIGIGHYEPLRHYAECWLRLSPGAPGSGIVFESACPVETLELNWQRLIRTHVFERAHPGVLTGSPVTDIKITLLTGRSHLKHTEGGDFREATYRAIRNGLMQARSILLEPCVRFELAMPEGCLARVTGELLRMNARLDAPVFEGDEVLLRGECTAAAFWDYPGRFAAATRGHGRIASAFAGYVPCKDQEEAVAGIGYQPLADTQNPPGSVFCSHGAGFNVAWEQVAAWAHCEYEES